MTNTTVDGGAWREWPTAEGYWWVAVWREGAWSRPVICACYRGRVAGLGAAGSLGRGEVQAPGTEVSRYQWAGLAEPPPPAWEVPVQVTAPSAHEAPPSPRPADLMTEALSALHASGG